jgi:hypothetical protein
MKEFVDEEYFQFERIAPKDSFNIPFVASSTASGVKRQSQ